MRWSWIGLRCLRATRLALETASSPGAVASSVRGLDPDRDVRGGRLGPGRPPVAVAATLAYDIRRADSRPIPTAGISQWLAVASRTALHALIDRVPAGFI